MSKYQSRFKKVTPFRYPFKKHKRTEKPPELSNYRGYKPFLKKEFKNKCVYCRKSDGMQDVSSFHVEHYRPKSIFPDLVSSYGNLYYSCASCNSFKGNYWSDQKGKQIVNPCDFIMSEHLKFTGARIDSLTDFGNTTVDVLKLNDEKSVSYRKLTQVLINNFLTTLGQLDLKANRNKLEESITYLSQIIGEDPDIVRSVLKVV